MLLSDPDRRIAKQFGVKRPGSLPNRRKTFVLDVAGQVRHVISSETNMEKHADEALAMILSLTNPEKKMGKIASHRGSPRCLSSYPLTKIRHLVA